MFPKKIIRRLQEIRRATFPTYNRITLDRQALKVLARLFVNPDCQADINLVSLKGRLVKLSRIGGHIITAAPATIAQYAERRGIVIICKQDLLRCFAIDHAHTVQENKIETKRNKYYALAHILNISRVVALRRARDAVVADVQSRIAGRLIIFRNVVVPADFPVRIGQDAYHHFGVVISAVDDEKLASEIQNLQKNDPYIPGLIRSFRQKKIIVDYKDQRIFSIDILDQILTQRSSRIKKPGDIVRGKIKFKH